MKRSEALLKLQRHYGIRHCMVEARYITPEQFCEEALSVMESLGMLAPFSELLSSKSNQDCNMISDAFEWEPEGE